MYCEHIDNETKQVFGLTSVQYEGYIEAGEIEQAYNGNWYVQGCAPQEPAPTEEEQRQKRAIAYKQEVDPITAHIQRLRDEEQTEEVISEIESLIAEREEKVKEIKQLYPYPIGGDE